MRRFRYYRVSMTTRIKTFDVIFVLLCVIATFMLFYDVLKKLDHEFLAVRVEKIDWHDWALIEREKLQTGLGEHGEGARLSYYPPHTKDINDTVGYNGYLSDRIALNRTLKDLRPPGCIAEKYSSELPRASVIIIFHNEHLRTLLRTCYSVWQRSPVVLLKEIILVDDASTMEGLSKDLKDYVDKYMPIVKLIRLDKRSGLMKARVVGAEAAESEVLVFLDSHCEAYHNWLPPLLHEIANDYRTVVCPTIDMVNSETFEQFRRGFKSVYAGRGGFDWNFDYKLFALLPLNEMNPSKPFETPVMAGGLFAIHATFFWELGAYDKGLETYGGEQYELSFKIWQCHGKMLENACSRVTHIYRNRKKPVNTHLHHDFFHRNYKRVAEVWMDEYKHHLYNRHPSEYAKVNVGDISEQLALRKRLQCKSFKWFMDTIAFDLLQHYPVEEPSFAYGGIRNLGANLCVDTMSRNDDAPLGLYPCAENITLPHSTQAFSLRLDYDIRLRFEKRCWSKRNENDVWLMGCSNITEDAIWRYDLEHKWIINKKEGHCLDINSERTQLTLSRCNAFNTNLMWDFGTVNRTAYQTKRWYRDWDVDIK